MSFKPVIPGNSYGQNLGQVNDMVRQLNKEQTVKVFKQAGGNAIIQGKLPSNTYGIQMNDSSQDSRILLGFAPSDGRPGLWITKPGKNVIDELNA